MALFFALSLVADLRPVPMDDDGKSEVSVANIFIVTVAIVFGWRYAVPLAAHMPALPSALRAAGLHFSQSRNSAMMAAPHLQWLVDRWAAPDWIPWANVLSIGDLLIAAGGLCIAVAATRPPRAPALRKSLIA